MTENEVNDLKAAKERLMESAQSLFSKLYEQSQGAGAQGNPGAGAQGGAGFGGNAGNTGSANNDDVVDGDFREV